MKLKKVIGIMIGISCMLTACTTASTEGTTVADNTSAQEANEEIITIIHVNDVHGYVDESDTAIGYAKIGAFIDRMKDENVNTIALDAGDTFAGAPTASFDRGESIVSILNTISFDAMTLGNNDFLLGGEEVASLVSKLNYPALAGNVRATGGNAWDDYVILTLESGIKVGIVSATTFAPDGLEFLDPVETTQALVDEVKPQANVVIALVHLGVTDASGNTSELLAQKVDGIDVIIDGHSHTVLENGLEVNGRLITQTGEYSNYIGVTKLVLKDRVFESASCSLVSKEEMADAQEKEETLAAVNELLAKSEVYFAQVVGETTVDLVGTRELVRTGETNLGSFFADAMREAAGAEIALCIAGGIGGEIPAGEITRKDILAIARVNVTYPMVELTGADLLEGLNEKVSEYPEPSGGFIQVSGMTYSFDSNREIGDRIVEVTINGEPLDLERVYTAAVSDGIGGAGFDNAVAAKEGTDLCSAILEEYIGKNSPISPKVEGRIIVVSE